MINRRGIMFAKIEISGIVEAVTGIHIGGNDQFSAIGAVDSPVIRDKMSDNPIIPGSSLKGKLRSLLARQYNTGMVKDCNEDDVRIKRLFGSSKKDEKGRIYASRLIFSDLMLDNAKELKEIGVSVTEVKFENTINRLTAIANPRQIERAIRGTRYKLNIIYNLENEAEFEEDMKTLKDGMRLIEYDYIGGHGSRGYGKIKFEKLEIKCVTGQIADDKLEKAVKILKGDE
ncbi:CRISPR-associated RAMP protein, Csm3 family [Catonella morbi ATCC 51271]|uniref:CRISPR system Cms endoribonuclease Csm3 n=2 Tax=Catonella TaxID=43996 RepID=V2Y4E4_9FIRM|nr:CRISPR-associated RAMP protein, Csm3 family [Catonella morbi ATCC 51271]